MGFRCFSIANLDCILFRYSIVSMSIGGPASVALDRAVTAAIVNGLHVVVCAGGSGTDVKLTSPARVPNAITVGAIDENNEPAQFSDSGAGLDIWALGLNVPSAWIGMLFASISGPQILLDVFQGNPDATKILSGTSMAGPYVAGILAVAIGRHGQETPEILSIKLKENAKPVVVNARPGTT